MTSVYLASLVDKTSGLPPPLLHTSSNQKPDGGTYRRLQSCVGTRVRFDYAAFDVQLWKTYSVTTLYGYTYTAISYVLNQNWNQSDPDLYPETQQNFLATNCKSNLYPVLQNSPKTCYSYRSDTDIMCAY